MDGEVVLQQALDHRPAGRLDRHADRGTSPKEVLEALGDNNEGCGAGGEVVKAVV